MKYQVILPTIVNVQESTFRQWFGAWSILLPFPSTATSKRCPNDVNPASLSSHLSQFKYMSTPLIFTLTEPFQVSLSLFCKVMLFNVLKHLSRTTWLKLNCFCGTKITSSMETCTNPVSSAGTEGEPV